MASIGKSLKTAQGALNMGTGLLGLYSAANPGEAKETAKYAGIMNNLSSIGTSIGNSSISNGVGGSEKDVIKSTPEAQPTALLRNGKGNKECAHCKHMEKYMSGSDMMKKYKDAKGKQIKMHSNKPKASDKKLATEYYAKGVEKEYKDGKC